MDVLRAALEFILDPRNNFPGELRTHVYLSGAALMMAIMVGVPLAVWLTRLGAAAQIIINVVGFLRVMPSLAVLFLLLPSQGIGFRPAVIALTLLAIPPLLINTYAGLRGVPPAMVEAGRGLGMSPWQLLRKVQLPVAMPVMLAGLRIAAVEVIASATLATLIGAGGLGNYINAGLSLRRDDALLAGAIPVALLALITEVGLAALQRRTLARYSPA